MNRTQTACIAALASVETINLILGDYRAAVLSLLMFASGFMIGRAIN